MLAHSIYLCMYTSDTSHHSAFIQWINSWPSKKIMQRTLNIWFDCAEERIIMQRIFVLLGYLLFLIIILILVQTRYYAYCRHAFNEIIQLVTSNQLLISAHTLNHYCLKKLRIFLKNIHDFQKPAFQIPASISSGAADS